MKKIISTLLVLILAISVLSSCGSKKEKVLIISSSEDFRNEYIQQMLDKKFPNYTIEVLYMPTGNSAAKLKAEGSNIDADIIMGLEVSYLKQNASSLAQLTSYDTSVFLDDLLPQDKTYLPWERYSGCIAIREDILKEKNLSIPTSYDDLLKPEYKGLITMPNPKISGTGYMFLQNLVNVRGEDEAFNYFDKLALNVLHFTTSGSGPVNDLVQGEAAIGLGMTFQGVSEINKGANIQIHYFAEGAPFNVGGVSVIKGKEERPAVKDVFDYIVSDVIKADKEKFAPEQIFKEQTNNIEHYPQNIKYADMTSADPVQTKERLLSKWAH